MIKDKNKNIKAIIGKGSNTLPSDEDVDGVIIGMSDFNKSNLQQVKNNIFTVSSGISAPKFSKFVANYGYSGAEFMTAIPGTSWWFTFNECWMLWKRDMGNCEKCSNN